MSEANVSTPCVAYSAMEQDWKLIRDLMGGTRSMQDASTTWLPQWTNEELTPYNTRLEATVLFNGLKRTVDVMTGKVFREDVVLGEDVPAQLVEWADNIDLRGTRLQGFCRKWFRDALELGLSHVLVDVPHAKVKTRAEEKAAGVRPYWIHVPAENLIAWRGETLGGVYQLVECRIKEYEAATVGQWGETTIEQIRRFYLDGGAVQWEVYRKGEDGKWARHDAGTLANVKSIPLVTFYTEETGFMQARPPLLDLAWLNLDHWRSTSEQRHCLGIARRPFPFFAGFSEKDVSNINIGPHHGVRSTKADARVEIIEPQSGNAIGAGRQHLQDLKEEMAVMGLEMLVRKPVTKTATEASQEKEETESALGTMVSDFRLAVAHALDLMAQWAKIEGGTGGTIELPTDVGISIGSADELQALDKARQRGDLSWWLFAQTLKRRAIIPEDTDLDQERARLDEEASQLPV